MTALVIVSTDVAPVRVGNTGREHLPVEAATVITAGMYGSLDANGHVVVGALDAAVGGNWVGIALSNSASTGQRVTFLSEGIVDLGAALDGLAFGDPVYRGASGVLDTAGLAADIIGYVWPGWNETTPSKLLKVGD